MFEKELLEQGADGSGADADEDVIDGDLGIVPVAVRIVEAGDAPSCEISEDVGVVWLPMSVVPLAYDHR
jgi:hypothetical protein